MKNLSRVLKLVMSLAMTITLVACSGKKKETVKLIDFTGLSKTDVESWLNDNHVDRELVFYSYEYSETVGADHVTHSLYIINKSRCKVRIWSRYRCRISFVMRS